MAEKTQNPKGKYFEAVGRRKSSIARVRIYPEDSSIGFVINNKSSQEYFNTEALMESAMSPLKKINVLQFGVSVKAKGGGITGQAEATRLGISRALVKYDEQLRLQLKKLGYLKRDPRAKERKKYGLRGARRAPQWSKR